MGNFIKWSLLRYIIFYNTIVFLSHTAFTSDLTIREKDEETLRIGSYKNLKVRRRASLSLGSFLIDPSEIQGFLRIRGGKAELEKSYFSNLLNI